MTCETKLAKSSNGWKASTEIEIGDSPADYTGFPAKRILRMTTSKDSRGNISAFAVTCERRDTGYRYSSECHALFGGYSKKVLAVVNKKATEKQVMAIHQEALASFPAIVEEAKQFYLTKQSAQEE